MADLAFEGVKTAAELTLARIRAKLGELKEIDPRCALFGASVHRYRLGSRLPESKVVGYERRLGVSLPDEYRRFLIEIGHGGAGPFYGLFPLDGSDPEDITDLEKICKPFRWAGAFNPVEWEDPAVEEDVWMDHDVDAGGKPGVFLNVPGVLYLCHYGCALRFFLIVKGLGVGEVWMDRQADSEGLVPECGEGGRRLGFLQWYEKWLDEGISNCRAR